MTDQTTTVAELRATMQRFVDERDWRQFHTPKNLSMAIAIESAELMEHFQWVGTEESRSVRDAPAHFGEVRDELADIMCYALSFANALDIDIAAAVADKLVKNAQKYPAERFRGRFR